MYQVTPESQYIVKPMSLQGYEIQFHLQGIMEQFGARLYSCIVESHANLAGTVQISYFQTSR